MASDPLVRRSKHLSLVLRHNPGSVGLTLDEAGWVDVRELLPAMKFSMGQLEDVVRNNNKKRFEFSPDRTKIRACQGHSVDVDLQYEPKVPPDRLYHGTIMNFMPKIRATGILRMKRTHVHLSLDVQTAVIVARRRGGVSEQVILEVDAKRMHEAAHQFYLSSNGVWLVLEVPPAFFRSMDPKEFQ